MALPWDKKLRKYSSSAHPEVPHYSIAILGAGSVGKTSLIHRLHLNEFQHDHLPTISEMYRIPIHRETETVAQFSVYDTAGSIEFPPMRRLTISKSDACMVVYAMDSMKSFETAKLLVDEVIEVRGECFPCVLVANKCDVTSRAVSFETGLRCAVSQGMSYVETSAKDDKNVEQAFDSVLSKIEAVSRRDILSRRETDSSTNKKNRRKTSSWKQLKRSSSSGFV